MALCFGGPLHGENISCPERDRSVFYPVYKDASWVKDGSVPVATTEKIEYRVRHIGYRDQTYRVLVMDGYPTEWVEWEINLYLEAAKWIRLLMLWLGPTIHPDAE